MRLKTAPPTPPAAIATIIVSPTAREKPTISAATMPETAAGTTTRRLVIRFRAPSPYDASRSELGHGVHRVLGDRRDERRDEDADRDACAGHVEDGRRAGAEGVDDRRRQHRQGEEAEHHARDRRQDLEDRLDGPPHAGAGVLGQEDRRAQAERRGDEHRDDGDHEGAGDDRQQVEVAGARLPRAAEQARQVDPGDERDRLADQRDDDEHRDDHRGRRGA